MSNFELVQLSTKDGVFHQGLFNQPTKNITRGLLWVHGLSGSFYSSVALVNEMQRASQDKNLGLALFNNRGHDSIVSLKIKDNTTASGYGYKNGGAGYEDFQESLFDIEAGIDFLFDKGMKEVVLVGHSTGSNKVAYYQAVKQDLRVKGVVLASPLSDRYGFKDQDLLAQKLTTMRQLVKAGKGEELQMGEMFFPITPKRFLSIFSPGPEDQMGYGEDPPQLPYVQQIKTPTLVILGDQDEYLDRPAEKVLTAFSNIGGNVTKALIVPGGSHNYKDSELLVATSIVDWALSLE